MGLFRDRVAEEICIKTLGAGAWAAVTPAEREAWLSQAFSTIDAYLVGERTQVPPPLQRRLDEIAVELGFTDAEVAAAVEREEYYAPPPPNPDGEVRPDPDPEVIP